MAEKLEGPMVALVTPKKKGHVVTIPLADHVGMLYEAGIRFIAPLGTTGSGFALAPAQKRDMLEASLELRDSYPGLEVICGVMRKSTEDIISQVELSGDSPYLLVAGPMQEDFDEDRIVRLFSAIEKHTAKRNPAPGILVYNFPGRMKKRFTFTANLIARIDDATYGRIVAVKDSADTPVLRDQMLELYEREPGRNRVAYFPGNDKYLAESLIMLRDSPHYRASLGYISGASNFLPIAIAEKALYDAVVAKDDARAKTIQEFLIKEVFEPVLWKYSKECKGEAPVLKFMMNALYGYPTEVENGLKQPETKYHHELAEHAKRIDQRVSELMKKS